MTRVGTFAVPGLVITCLSAGITVAVWPDTSAGSAEPAPQAAINETVIAQPTSTQPAIVQQTAPSSTPSARADRPNRGNARPSVQPSSASRSRQPTTGTKAKPATKDKPATKRTVTKRTRPKVIAKWYTTVGLNVRTKPSDDGSLITVLDRADRVPITTNKGDGWQQVVFSDRIGWVHSQYLTEKKPAQQKPESSDRSSANGPCPSGSSVESGLTSDAVRVYRAVCHQFPQITSYGGIRADSLPEHPSGRAVDVMLPGGGVGSNGLGWQIANWLKANSGRLDVSQLIFDQKIWTVQRGGEGWRPMSSRGGATADHRDHVHVTV